MEFLTNTNIDFMKYRKVFVWVSLLFLVVAVGELFFFTGLNLGIDFAGGSQLQVRFKEPVAVDEVRRVLENAGLRDAQIQQFGEAEENEILIKTPVVAGSEEGNSKEILAALDGAMNGGGEDFDLNQRGANALAGILVEADPDGRLAAGDTDDERLAYYEGVAERILDVRREQMVLADWSQIEDAEGISPATVAALQEGALLGAFSVQSIENVGPQIGGELATKGVLALVLSLIGMLVYIWFRFELRFGVGALVAVFHDFLIVLGLYALFDFEFNLATIAAFLTLVGYSVNDTVVIFDRVRENMRRFRRRNLVDIMNQSLNQTLTRTILTSGTTLVAIGCLFFLGGAALRGFSFVLLIGIVVGTYSSVFVASPFALLWEQLFGGEARERRHVARQQRAT